MEGIPFFSAQEIHSLLSYTELIQALRSGFTKAYEIPPRMHFDYDNGAHPNTLLLMPAVKCGEVAGVKIISVAPENASKTLPTIQGIYYLMDADTGVPMALIEAKALTNWRTAAASALAATYLAPKNAKTLLMVGTGSLAPFLIDAHAASRPINKVLIYGCNTDKAKRIASKKQDFFESVEVVESLESAIEQAEIISAATMSSEPLIKGSWLKAGQHIDLVGSFKPTMREADDEVIRRSSVFVDTLEMAPIESGDLAIPLKEGVIEESAIRGDLFQLCKGEVKGREKDEEITLFKSVGHALEDLVTAQLIIKLSEN